MRRFTEAFGLENACCAESWLSKTSDVICLWDAFFIMCFSNGQLVSQDLTIFECNGVVPSDVIIFVRLRATMRRGPACPSCAQGNGGRAGAASTGRSGLEEGGGHPDAGHWWSLAAATPAQVRSATLPALRSRTRLPRLDGPVAVDLLLGDAVVPHPTHEVAHLPAMVAPAGTQKCTRSRPPGLTLSDVMMSCQD